ncbi:MAG: nitrite reductase small subunit NirD [Gammaproteobacteria bacterium]|jgi:nitrite reductase (NADH) small subunit|nr:nitrite reductase small subunit NirD [Gammaproteobacteria bacterium]
MNDWIEVGSIDDIPILGSRVITTHLGDIAVFRNAKDEIFALNDRCPHKGGPLSQGLVHGRSVTCPLHNWVLGLENGQALAPDEGCTTAYPVKLHDNMVFISLQAR